LRLVVEELHLRRRARLVEENHALGLGREVGQTHKAAGLWVSRLGGVTVQGQERRQRRDSNARASDALGEEQASRHPQCKLVSQAHVLAPRLWSAEACFRFALRTQQPQRKQASALQSSFLR